MYILLKRQMNKIMKAIVDYYKMVIGLGAAGVATFCGLDVDFDEISTIPTVYKAMQIMSMIIGTVLFVIEIVIWVKFGFVRMFLIGLAITVIAMLSYLTFILIMRKVNK